MQLSWIKCDDGQCWDARDVGSVYRIPTVQEAAEKLIAVTNAPGASRNSIEWGSAWDWLERAVQEARRES